MPANLPPVYLKAERDYRRAQSAGEQVKCLQHMLQLIPKHKGTDKLQADIKSRLKEARQKLQQQTDAPKDGRSFRIPRQGAGRVVVIGGPNSGKSSIVGRLTGSEPAVAPYPFTTREPLPAMMNIRKVQVQLVDMPPVSGPPEPWMLNLIRTADAALLVFDGSSDDAVTDTLEVIQELAARKTKLSDVTGFDPREFAAVNIATLLVVTHADDPDSSLRHDLFRETADHTFPRCLFCPDDDESVSQLAEEIYRLLNIIRVFTKPPGRPPDMQSPLTTHVGSTVEELALQLHEDLARDFRHARLWRQGGHDGQTVGRDYELQDEDIIELHHG